MKPFFLLIAVFIISLLAAYLLGWGYDFAFAGRTAMSAMLVFTSIGHFIYTAGMTMMVPASIPFKKELVYFTGIVELAAAVGLHIAGLRVLTAWLLILFFVLLLPANINAAKKHIDYQKGTPEGPGPRYLWFRVPLQILFIIWVYYFCIRKW